MDEIKLIEVKEGILSDNDRIAGELRRKLAEEKTFLLNLMGSPGSGKTTLILKTIEKLKNRFAIGVIEADIESIVDAEKVAAQGIRTVQLRTGGFCHLDATMVAEGLNALETDSFDLIIIENVGNLVCPAEFDTGAALNGMILSIPEGDDKPLKYPLMFTVSDVLLTTKIDCLGDSDFDVRVFKDRVLRLKPDMKIFEVSSQTGQGMDDWVQWLEDKVSVFLGRSCLGGMSSRKNHRNGDT